jgi:hypothetical protein
LEHIFAQAESYLSSLGGLPDLERLRLWRELLLQLTGRLCRLRKDLTALDEAADKLGEIDAPAEWVTAALAEADLEELATGACARIRSNRLRLTTRLRRLPASVLALEELEPEPLYRALASVARLDDEWRGLAALHDPDPPEIVFRRHIEPMDDGDTRVITLFRLAAKALEAPCPSRRTRKFVLQMLGQALANLHSDVRLVALTPSLPILAGRADPGLLLSETREAFVHLVNLMTVAWPLRRGAIERLLVSLGSCPAQRASELFGELEGLLADGIPGQDEDAAADLLPVLTAARERLPAEVATIAKQPWGGRLRFSDATSEQIRKLCQASMEERLRTLERIEEIEPSSRVVQALVFLLLQGGTDPILSMIDRWPRGSERDDVCHRLVLHGWVAEEAAGELIRRMEDSRLTLEATVWTSHASHGTAEWTALFATLAVEYGGDPSDPAWVLLVQDLWSGEPEPRRQILAETVLAALGKEAPQTAEKALRLWLHAHLSPRDDCGKTGTCDKALGAIRAALSLSSPA